MNDRGGKEARFRKREGPPEARRVDKKRLDDKLDEALADTSPASDPVKLAPDRD